MRGIIILIAAALCLGGAVAEARISYLWSFEELQAKSDAVVIAQWLGTRDMNVKAVFDDVQPPYPVVTLNSDFKVLTTLKGEATLKTLRLKHFRTDTELLPGAVLNGPVLVAFDRDPVNVYLLFLRKDVDGLYSPTSGQVDPYVSVLMLPKQSIAAAAGQSGQANRCPANWPELQPSDPAYSEAAAFAGTLADRGVVVNCVAPSHMTGMFEGQEGAALYRTSLGDFDALFMTASERFSGLRIVERRQDGRYLYSFEGTPKPSSPNQMNAAGPMYFVRQLNRLIVAYDKELVAALEPLLTR